MRLTLRTLLAYLDDILEEDDIQVLKAKIEESPRATQLIDRIRKSVDNGAIGALSPDAIGPLENANATGEYLDSTLSPEQIAEIERLCLDSDVSLAEAAACHQILTVVLGQPAQVPDHLRQRIYDLPLSDALRTMEQQTRPAADARAAGKMAPVGESVSSLDLDRAPPGNDAALAAGLPGADDIQFATSGPMDGDLDGDLAGAATKIRPVGPDDSGVSHAAVRMRSDADELEGQSEAEIVARTTRAMQENAGTYGGSIRPSRITPWLVTLAMAGVVAYVLMQIFSPLAKRRVREVGAVAMQDIDNGATPILEPTVTPPDQPPPQLPPATTTDPTAATDPIQPGEASSVAEPSSPASTGPESPTPQAVPSQASDSPDPAIMTPPDRLIPEVPAPPVPPAATEEEMPNEAVVEVVPEPSGENSSAATTAMTELEPSASIETTPAVAVPLKADEQNLDLKTGDTIAGDMESDDVKSAEMSDPPAVSESPATDSDIIVAQLNNEDALVLAETSQGWSRLVSPTSDATTNPFISNSVRSGQAVIAPALYRPILANEEGLEWTLAGPTRLRITRETSDATRTEVIDGRLLLASTVPGVTTRLQLGPRKVQLVMPDAQTVLAIEMVHLRPAGVDPLVPENRRPIYRVIVVQGEAIVRSELVSQSDQSKTGSAVTLQTGQQWQARDDQDPAVTTVSLLPTWIDDAAQKNLAIASARDGLMDFFGKEEPIEKALREAMAFRRVEVAALAAETLLLLGRADVYFGSDGILSRPRQRLFWTEHFQMLRQHIASDAKAAADVKSAIALAELADSDNLFKLLVGFTNEELADGGDEKLVKLLDSASMPVRVLAIENLKAIVGDNLGYRADQENANTRRADIKKWEARLRKDDIRYAN